MKTDRKLNILLLTDGIHPYVLGGMQKHSLIISKLFAKNQHKVTLFHCGFFGKKDFNEDYSKIFNAEELNYITLKFVPLLDSGKMPGHYIMANKNYSLDIKNHIGINLSKYDIIYAQGLTGYSFLNNNLNIPVITNLHGFEMFQKAANLKVKLEQYLLKPIVKKIVNESDHVLSFGGQIDTILESLNTPTEKIIKQSNGIEKSWITNKKIKTCPITTFTFIGRFERRKGIEELTDALKNVNSNLDFQFNFIGPIPENNKIENPKIKYFGEISDPSKIQDILDSSDFLVSPSYAEGMPTVILEAMARGNAIIATNVGANIEMLVDTNWIIESNKESIEEIIAKAINLDKTELLSLKNKSLELVKEKYIWEKVIDNKIKQLHKIVAHKK
jgi:glycosyltransferase involved in cell wall biosynthesis